MAKRAEDLALAKGVERLIGKPLERDSKNDESNVAVFNVRARAGHKFGGESQAEKIFAVPRAEEEFFISRKTGAMCQQHAEGDCGGDARPSRKIQGRSAVTGASRSSMPRS